MKFSFLNPWRKPKIGIGEKPINPFHMDMTSMGTQIGDGRLFVMFTKHTDYKDVYLVDTLTGQRVHIEFDNPITIK